MRSQRVPLFTILLTVAGLGLLAFALGGCSDSTNEPPLDTDTTGGALVDGSLDPAQESFVLETLDIAPDGMPRIPIQLIGSNLVVDADSQLVSLDVAILNRYSEPLIAPGAVFLSRLDPAEVVPINADGVIIPSDMVDGPLGDVEYYFDYADELGDDGILQPEETSGAKTWVFNDPGLVPFSFAARAAFGIAPAEPRIAGVCFWDHNLNGIRDADDPPLPTGLVIMALPNGDSVRTYSDDRGTYSFPVHQSGLYTLTFDPLIDTLVPIVFTTPNPRLVLLTPGPDGLPQSYLGAHFGLGNEPIPRPEAIQFTDLPPDSLRIGDWVLIEAEILPRLVLKMHVGYSGCGPEQDTSLYMSGGIMESYPPQANIVFVKEHNDECDAYWTTDHFFDIAPLADRYFEAYGPGILILNLVDYEGTVHKLEFPIFPED